MTTYDTVPYPSYSYAQSSPAHLHAISSLFGLKPVDCKTAKVLEIGCATGGNILPLAARFPDAEFVGIDLSKNQIALAKSKAETLGLTNIKFIASSIVDQNFKREKFDYIIAHAIYSWVPDNVQKRVLEICGDHLSKNGVAYVSYNTLPGWNAVKTVRDMMLYHGNNFEDPAQKVGEARKMLNFVAQNMQAQSGPYKETLETEINAVQNVSDNYLLHDHLESVNEPCYFHEFATKAQQQGLAYLADTDLPSMFLGNQNEQVSATLAQMDDPIRQEQYLDFINNRRFRMSLLVKEGAQINRQITPKCLEGLRFISNYQLSQPLDVSEFGKIEELDLVGIHSSIHQANIKGHIACTAMLEVLRARPKRLTINEVIEATSSILKDVERDAIQQEVESLFLNYIFNGILSITSDDVAAAVEVSEKPSVFSPAILQGQAMDIVPNLYHGSVKLTNDQRLILQYVNGQNTKQEICDAVKSHLEKGELTLNANGEPLTKETENYENLVLQYVEGGLSLFANNALLVA